MAHCRRGQNLVAAGAKKEGLHLHGEDIRIDHAYRHNYTLAQLADWATEIKKAEATRVWACFNNDREGFAIQNVKKLLTLLK